MSMITHGRVQKVLKDHLQAGPSSQNKTLLLLKEPDFKLSVIIDQMKKRPVTC